jgi:FKBP-type peptidyl-prolyl cis-trans isomerase FkpA
MHASRFLAVALVCVAVSACGQQGGSKELKELTTDVQKGSYALGMDVASYLKRMDVEVDLDAVALGLRHGIAGGDSLLTAPELAQAMKDFQQRAQESMVAKQKAAAAENSTKGTAFLNENKSKSGVQTTASGLQYQVLSEGTGPKPKATDTVSVNYTGTLIDGTKFDSSYDRGQPVTFPVNGVIPGWTEGLQLMNVGSKYKFFIPGELAYGERSPGPEIPPNSTLIFEVELLSIGEAQK